MKRTYTQSQQDQQSSSNYQDDPYCYSSSQNANKRPRDDKMNMMDNQSNSRMSDQRQSARKQDVRERSRQGGFHGESNHHNMMPPSN